MEFCEICRNMLYLTSKPQDPDTEQGNANGTPEDCLMKYCKHCKWSTIQDTSKNMPIRVAFTLYSEDDLLNKQHYNPYLRFDPTLPRIQDPSISCTNPKCTGPRDKPQMIYVKYHPENMKYFYCCDYCGEQRDEDKK
jgi:hypothetical protein